jgi:hypothetical protein
MSDYNHTDGRPDASEYGPLQGAHSYNEEIYINHHGKLIGLEVSPWDHPCRAHGVLGATIGLSPDAARDIAEQLLAMADRMEGKPSEYRGILSSDTPPRTP